MARGQIIMEFGIMLAFAVLIGMIYLATTTRVLNDVSDQQRITALNDVGFMVQDEVLLAETVNDGYTRTITIPTLADRFTYNITSDATSLTLTSGQLVMTYSLPPVSGTFQQGANIISKNGGITVMPG